MHDESEGNILDILQALILALVQGVTEFLPISSSAHLILPSILLGWPDQGLVFDTTVHLATLTAVVFYFRKDLQGLVAGSWQPTLPSDSTDSTDRQQQGASFLLCLMIASLPVLLAGFLAREWVANELRDPLVIALATLVFGLLLGLADWRGKAGKPEETLSPATALAIGLAQCLALIPGTSRSGVTITMALLVGFSRQAAARISFLISIPAIAGAALLNLHDLFMATGSTDGIASQVSAAFMTQLAIGFVVAGLAAWLSIKLFLDFIARISFMPFVIYRVLLGCLLLTFIL